MEALIEIQYLPPIEYFCILASFKEAILEKNEQYIKQTYRNRCYINTANGVVKLVVPVTAKHGKALVKDVQIDHSSKWQNIHWRAIESAYRKSPYFEFYADQLHAILFSNHKFLFDLNKELLSFCLQSSGISTTLTESSVFKKVPDLDIKDFRSAISPKKPYSERSYYQSSPYVQVFGNKFVSNLSFIDLLFCEGPNSIHVISSSSRGYLNK